jgi:hypothetical protein
MGAHPQEASIVCASPADEHGVDGGLHVVVDPAPTDPAPSRTRKRQPKPQIEGLDFDAKNTPQGDNIAGVLTRCRWCGTGVPNTPRSQRPRQIAPPPPVPTSQSAPLRSDDHANHRISSCHPCWPPPSQQGESDHPRVGQPLFPESTRTQPALGSITPAGGQYQTSRGQASQRGSRY